MIISSDQQWLGYGRRPAHRWPLLYLLRVQQTLSAFKNNWNKARRYCDQNNITVQNFELYTRWKYTEERLKDFLAWTVSLNISLLFCRHWGLNLLLKINLIGQTNILFSTRQYTFVEHVISNKNIWIVFLPSNGTC